MKTFSSLTCLFLLGILRFGYTHQEQLPPLFLCQLYLDHSTVCFPGINTSEKQHQSIPRRSNGNASELFQETMAEWFACVNMSDSVNGTWQVEQIKMPEQNGTNPLTCIFNHRSAGYQCIDFYHASLVSNNGTAHTNATLYDQVHTFLNGIQRGERFTGGPGGELSLSPNAILALPEDPNRWEDNGFFICELHSDRTTLCYKKRPDKEVDDISSAESRFIDAWYGVVKLDEPVPGTWKDWPGTYVSHSPREGQAKLQSLCLFNHPPGMVLCSSEFPHSRDKDGKIRVGLSLDVVGEYFSGGPGETLILNSFPKKWVDLLPESFISAAEMKRNEPGKTGNHTFNPQSDQFSCNFYSDSTTVCYIGIRAYSMDDSYNEIYPNELDEWAGILGPGEPIMGTWAAGAWPIHASASTTNATRAYMGTCCFGYPGSLEMGQWQCNNATDYHSDSEGYLSGLVKGIYMGYDYSGGPGGTLTLSATDNVHLVTGPIKELAL
ncbi:hypothetical protein BV898_00555 [Hypsibius exemplaris]|uniref:Uncharacterized protein n=1 Tax=Hypsibius exemplaris TaxID=2072580 RepID=A0A1W0XDS1_HYPEX|nr:hypothetical protein BV898_00555 [Hypsibius exemplaris]